MCHAHMCVVLSHLAHHPGFCEFLLSMYLTTATATLNLSVAFFRERERDLPECHTLFNSAPIFSRDTCRQFQLMAAAAAKENSKCVSAK